MTAPLRPHPDGLVLLLRCALPGCCIVCDEPLSSQPFGRRVICRKPECKRVRERCYYRDRRRGVTMRGYASKAARRRYEGTAV